MCIIICKNNQYQRTASGKSWQQKPCETELFEMSELVFFSNFQSPDTFMKALGGTERIYKGYTCIGYVTKRDVCTLPSRDKKVEKLFYIYQDEKDLQENGTVDIKAFWNKQKEHNNK